MQTTPTLGPDHHVTLLDEPMHSLLKHRLDDLERRLIDMSQTMDRLLRQPAGSDADASIHRRPEQAVLDQVRAARAKLEAGNYGQCDSCDAPIESHRLANRPQVQHCGFCEQQVRQR